MDFSAKKSKPKPAKKRRPRYGSAGKEARAARIAASRALAAPHTACYGIAVTDPSIVQ